MKLGLRQMIALVPALLFAIVVPAQDLPKMPSDPVVSSGVLPNGLSYFIASNASEKGLADFALIQKTGVSNVTDSIADSGCAVTLAREALASVHRLRNSSPQKFFSRHGSVPGKDGYVSVNEDATMFSFPGVRLSDHTAVLDSALLVLLDMADRRTFSDNPFLKRWYSPGDQAVVVAGDVDAKSVLSRLEAMSYMIPPSPSSDRSMFHPEDSSKVSVSETGVTKSLRDISMTWISKRAPREYMNTIQPVIFDKALDVLGKVAVRRVRSELEAERIPSADVSYIHRRTDEGPGDDVFALHASVYPDDVQKTAEVMAAVMSSIDAHGVSVDEYVLAESEFMSELKTRAGRSYRSNAEYVERCRAAFMYDSHLSSLKQIYSFHTARELPDSVRCRYFNDLASAFIYPLAGEADSSRCDSVPAFSPVDLPAPGVKVKLKSVRKDHLSGGSVWTFSNGFKVVYHNMPSDGEVYYTLALNGGYGGMSGMNPGEGAFVSDIFRLSRIAGVKGDDFFTALMKEGLVMEPRVTMSNTLIGGHLRKDRIPLLMKALLALSLDHSPMDESYSYYRDCEEAALEHPRSIYASRMTVIDSLMCPGYRFSPYKSKGVLDDSFYTKAYAFLTEQMQKLNDGVLVLVGDVGEEYLKQQLMTYVGSLPVKDVSAKKTMVRYQPVSGWSTYAVKGAEDAVDVAFSARMPLTFTNYLAACVAVMTVEKGLQEVLADSGMSFEVLYNCRIYPEERMNMLISVRGSDPEGFAPGYTAGSPIDVLGKVRNALSELTFKEITDDEFKKYKAYLKNRLSVSMKDPQYWVDAIIVRHLDGKDLTTGYAANIDALSKNDVKRVLALLDRGSKVEYVTEQ